MSRTEGIHFPRLPTSHARTVSSNVIQHHTAPTITRYKSYSEPNYTAYVGTPRQDVPPHIYESPPMFDEVFDRQGRLLSSRNTPKITSPLNSLQYNSLHDPHCKRLFLNNQALRNHLIQLGLLTDDLRVISSTKEQRQKIRAHELLERKEQLVQKLERREKERLGKLQNNNFRKFPQNYQRNMSKMEGKKASWEKIQKLKMEKALKEQEITKQKEMEKLREHKQKLQKLIEQIKLEKQEKQNAIMLHQQRAEAIAYEKQYGKTAIWHRESDRIHNRMVLLSRTKWAKMKQKHKKVALASPELVSPPPSLCTPLPVILPQVDKEKKDIEKREIEQEQEEIKQEQQVQEDQEKDQLQEKGPSLLQYQEQLKEEETEKQETEHQQLQTVEAKSGDDISTAKEIDDGRILDQHQSTIQLINIFTELLNNTNQLGIGIISFEDLYYLLESSDLALPLDHDELNYLTSIIPSYNNGMIPIIEASRAIPLYMIEIFASRMDLQMQQYGRYVEDRWLQLSSPSFGYIYMEKQTGLVQLSRPDDYRPYLKDNMFEDIIVNLFQTADYNRDGYIDELEIYSFLTSPEMSQRIYPEQSEQMYQLFRDISIDGFLNLEQFVPLAHKLLHTIYSLCYPEEEWIELPSRKCNKFLYNLQTGEVSMPSAEENSQIKKQKKKKKQLKDDKKPPPLRKRKPSFNLFEIDKEEEDEVVSESLSRDQETTKLVEEVVEKLHNNLRIIDTIPEEDEERDIDESPNEQNKDDVIDNIQHNNTN